MNLTRWTQRVRLGCGAVVTALALLGLSACGGSDPAPGSADSAAQIAPDMTVADAGIDVGRDIPTGLSYQDEAVAGAPMASMAFDEAAGKAETAPMDRAVIKNGAVTLESDDVLDTHDDIVAILDEAGGHLDSESTRTNDDGVATRSRMVLRVPVKAFDATMTRLEDVATAVSSSQSGEDVTTEVIDVNARIRVQQASVDRIAALLARANTIRAIVAIENQLSRRQAELESLKAQQKYLANQTSLATIAVNLTLPEKHKETKESRDGFVGGLKSGWDQLGDTVNGVLKATGAVLPFAGLAFVLIAPIVMIRRRRRA